MNRSEFFAEMRKGLFKTIKEISAPFIQEDLEKLDQLADQVTGVKWQIAGNKGSFAAGDVHELFLAGQSIILVCGEKEFTAFKKLCLSCGTMLQWIPYEKKLKCFSCENEYQIEEGRGDLKLQRCPAKISGENLLIGISAD